MSQSTWLPWDPEHHELWLNSIPPEAICLENQEFPFFKVGMSDYEFQSKFCQWLHREKEVVRTAVLVGIRAQESLNRYNAVTREETFSRFGTTNFSHRISQDVFNFYPMYDWLFEDIWRANAKFDLDYNHLYDYGKVYFLEIIFQNTLLISLHLYFQTFHYFLVLSLLISLLLLN